MFALIDTLSIFMNHRHVQILIHVVSPFNTQARAATSRSARAHASRAQKGKQRVAT